MERLEVDSYLFEVSFFIQFVSNLAFKKNGQILECRDADIMGGNAALAVQERSQGVEALFLLF